MGQIALTMKRFLSGAVVFCNRIAASLSQGRELHKARFAGLHELVSLLGSALDRETSLLLGASHFSHVLRVQPTPTRRELGNLLIVAPTRGGKGLLAISQLLTWPHSVIVNDIKGELYNQTAGYRATLGDVFRFGPDGRGHRYDPLLGKVSEKDLLSSALSLLHQPEEKEPIFSLRAATMLTQIFLAAQLEDQPALPYVRRLVQLGLFDTAQKLNAISHEYHAYPNLATQFLDNRLEFTDFKDKFLQSCWSTLSTQMRRLLSDTVVRCFTSSDFTGREIMQARKPVTVYLCWPEQDLLLLSPLVRLLWGSLIDELLATYDRCQGKDCHPVLLLIDEAGRTAIPSLADHATTVVGRGISLWIAIQSLSQLDAVYGRARAHILRDNMETQIYYRPANQETAEYLERCLGRRSGYAHSETLHEGAETAESLSEQGVPLMTAQAIKQMGDEDILGFHRRLPPFQARRMDWRRFPLLVQRRAMSPPKLAALPKLEERLPPLAGEGRGEFMSEYIDPDLL